MLEKARTLGIGNVTLVGDRWIGVSRDGGLFVFQRQWHRWVRYVQQTKEAA